MGKNNVLSATHDKGCSALSYLCSTARTAKPETPSVRSFEDWIKQHRRPPARV